MTKKVVTVVTTAGPLRAEADAGRLVLSTDVGYSWRPFPSLFRLLLKGSGTVTMDSLDYDGTVNLAVESYTVTTDTVVFPYAGDNAIAIRVTNTGTASAEIL